MNTQVRMGWPELRIESMPVAVGATLQGGKYCLDAVLGEGGFGITYRATHTLLQQVVVVKTLKAKQEDSPEFAALQQRFMSEARILAQFQHPHIVRVSDCFVENGLPFIVMDYIPGRTLGDVSRNHPLPEEDALAYVRQVGSALQEIHKQGLVHRDVKPDNIILKESTNKVILIDFGIARHFTLGITETNTGMVSAGYAPIEQYLPRHQWTPATDVYALAATLYALLAGQPPVAAVLRDRLSLTDLHEFQPHLKAVTKQAVLRGMAMEVNQRPESISAWLRLLPSPVEALATPNSSRTGTRTAATVNVLARGGVQQVAPATKLQVRSKQLDPQIQDWDDAEMNSVAVLSPRRHKSLVLPLILTAMGAGIFGAGTGLLLRSFPIPSWGPTLLEQRELFPEKIPPVQRPVPPVEGAPAPEPAPLPGGAEAPYAPVDPAPTESWTPEADYSPPAEPAGPIPPPSNDSPAAQPPVEPASPAPPVAAPAPVEPAPVPEPLPVEPISPPPAPAQEAPAAPAPATP